MRPETPFVVQFTSCSDSGKRRGPGVHALSASAQAQAPLTGDQAAGTVKATCCSLPGIYAQPQ